MNHNKRVVQFTLAAVALLLGASFAAEFSGNDFFRLHNVSLIADVLKKPGNGTTPGANPNDPADLPIVTDTAIVGGVARTAAPTAFDRYYNQPGRLVHFAADSAQPALPRFITALNELKAGKKRKVRIAWFGDSLIEGDQMTKTVRRKLQEAFGGYGVGFVPIESAVSQFRTSVRHSWSGDWQEQSFKNKETTAPLYPSGHLYYTADGTVNLKDLTYNDSSRILVKSLICGPAAGPVTIVVNGQQRSISPTQPLNRIVLDSGRGLAVTLTVKDASLPVYGVTLEPESGVVLDNFSFRGITGVELNKLDADFLKSMNASNDYDLVILEYGANLLFRPNDVNQNWYKGKMQPILKKLHNAMPASDFLLVSTGDRAFRYNGKWETAVGLDTLVRTQAELAYENNFAFFNLFAAMGGKGTIVRWAEVESPSMANKDYIHPNGRGADWLADVFFKAFVEDSRKKASN